MKRNFFLLLFFLCSAICFSEQITKIGVLNFDRVKAEAGDSGKSYEIERMEKSLNDWITIMKNDIAVFEERKEYYISIEDNYNIQRIEKQINEKQQQLAEGTRIRRNNIDEQKKKSGYLLNLLQDF
jgi:Skp family chaperone for outer membrane proteins